MGFPCGSAGKESTCNVGELGLIPGLGRSPVEGKGSVQFSLSVTSDSLQPHGLQHPRRPYPSPTPRSLPKLMSMESVLPSNHLILCCPLCLLPSIILEIYFQRIRLEVGSYRLELLLHQLIKDQTLSTFHSSLSAC